MPIRLHRSSWSVAQLFCWPSSRGLAVLVALRCGFQAGVTCGGVSVQTAGGSGNLTAAFNAAVACIAPAQVMGQPPACLPMTTAADVTPECVQAVSTMRYTGYRCACCDSP